MFEPRVSPPINSTKTNFLDPRMARSTWELNWCELSTAHSGIVRDHANSHDTTRAQGKTHDYILSSLVFVVKQIGFSHTWSNSTLSSRSIYTMHDKFSIFFMFPILFCSRRIAIAILSICVTGVIERYAEKHQLSSLTSKRILLVKLVMVY